MNNTIRSIPMARLMVLVLLFVGLAPFGPGVVTATAAPASQGRAAAPAPRVKSLRAVSKMKRREQRKLDKRAAEAHASATTFLAQLDQQANMARRAGNRFVVPQTREFAERAHELMREQANTLRAMATLRSQLIRDYAAERNIVLRPRAAPVAPAVAVNSLAVPESEPRPAKSFMPPRGTPLMTQSSPKRGGR
jgi:hypothetical protein